MSSLLTNMSAMSALQNLVGDAKVAAADPGADLLRPPRCKRGRQCRLLVHFDHHEIRYGRPLRRYRRAEPGLVHGRCRHGRPEQHAHHPQPDETGSGDRADPRRRHHQDPDRHRGPAGPAQEHRLLGLVQRREPAFHRLERDRLFGHDQHHRVLLALQQRRGDDRHDRHQQREHHAWSTPTRPRQATSAF